MGIRVQHLRCNVSISTAIRRRTGEKGAWVEAKHAVNRLLKGLVQAECHDHFCSNETRPVDVDDDGQFPPDAFSLQTRQRGAGELLLSPECFCSITASVATKNYLASVAGP